MVRGEEGLRDTEEEGRKGEYGEFLSSSTSTEYRSVRELANRELRTDQRGVRSHLDQDR